MPNKEVCEMSDNNELRKRISDINQLFSNVDRYYKLAIRKYGDYEKLINNSINKLTLTNDKKHGDVFHSWGDIHSHCGRNYRYNYLSLIEKWKISKDDSDVEKIETNINLAIKSFNLAINEYKKAEKIVKGGNEKEEINLMLGVTYYRLFLTYCVKENYKKKDNDKWETPYEAAKEKIPAEKFLNP